MAGSSAPQFASLYVGDLHPDVTEAMLYEIFNSVGPVASIRVCRDTASRRSLGYGYVNFHSVSDAERGLDTLNYSSIKGRACRIMWSQRDPSLRKSGTGNVYVKNLDRNIDNKALFDTFSLFGHILSCKVATDPNGKSRGYGFVHYENEEAARSAIDRVNGMQIGDKTVEVTSFLKRGDREGPSKNYTNIYTKNFPNDWDEAKISEVFGQVGAVTSTCVMSDQKDRKFAFINFADSESAKKAIDVLHKTDQRSEEQKEKDKAEGKEEEQANAEHPSWLLYVTRAQTKSERGRTLRERFNATERSSTSTRAQGVNLYVKNLDESADDDTLRELFSPFGTITSVAAMKDDKGTCKGFGFVSFQSSDEATKAVTEMHLKVVKGKPLYVGLAEKREARQERLRQRYSPGGGPGGPTGPGMAGPGMAGAGMGGPGMGGPGMPSGPMGGPGMFGGKGGKGGGKPGIMPGMQYPMGGGGMGGMPYSGMQGGMMPRPGMGGPQGMMYPPQMMGMARPPMMGPRGPMMGTPQMTPQMMAQMGKGAMGPAGGMGGPGAMGVPGMGCKGMWPGMGMPGGPGMMGPGMMGMGMRPQMPPAMGAGGMQPQQDPQQQQQQMQAGKASLPQAAGQPVPSQPLTAAALANAPVPVQKQMIGEKLFPAISRHQPELAGKITGMMLEMDNSELLMLLESEDALKIKVDEAMRVLETSRS
eukprot:TRINITY_DN810_c0_g5_i1.p1 TRINITY_DN810_c0_g5~~TRINITY_DN810_c0_g5_i1.p1  ORF type:complete len:701 (-),score=127.01 TRINITY_DN810_c0_g5_i1:206-2308(-)